MCKSRKNIRVVKHWLGMYKRACALHRCVTQRARSGPALAPVPSRACCRARARPRELQSHRASRRPVAARRWGRWGAWGGAGGVVQGRRASWSLGEAGGLGGEHRSARLRKVAKAVGACKGGAALYKKGGGGKLSRGRTRAVAPRQPSKARAPAPLTRLGAWL